MEATSIAKQTIGFQKTVFENSYSSMVFFQDKTEEMMNGMLNQMPWVTEEGKKAMKGASEIVKKSREDFKNVVDDGYTKLEDMVTKK